MRLLSFPSQQSASFACVLYEEALDSQRCLLRDYWQEPRDDLLSSPAQPMAAVGLSQTQLSST